MDQYSTIGRLYLALIDAQEQKQALISIVRGLKEGTITTDQVEVDSSTVRFLPAEQHNA